MASLKSVIKCWKEFNLPELHKELDQTASDVALRQDEAEISRKRLIELTKDFRKSADEETRKRISPLIKAFQGEVDTLTKRSKAAEGSFLNLYKRILEVPDPSPYLDQVQKYQQQLSKAKDLEIENKKLRETLDEYHSEFAEVKNQEVTINKLKQEIRDYEERAESKVKERLQAQEKELQGKFEARERQLQQMQLEAAGKLGEAEEKIRLCQVSLDEAHSELFAVRAKAEEEGAARLAEIELIENDLEISNQRAHAAEKFVESLQEQLTLALSARAETDEKQETVGQYSISSALEGQLLEKEREMDKVMGEVHYLQTTLTKTRENAKREVTALEGQLKSLSETVQVCQKKLGEQSDYDDIKRELGVLKMIEFGGMLNESNKNGKSVQQLLQEKNKALQNENANLHVSNQELRVKCCDLEKSNGESQRKVKEQAELIGQLEHDLMSVNAVSSAFRGEGEGEANPSETELVGKVVLEIDQDSDTKKVDNESMLSIVASQRERFRNRTLELEAQGRHNQQQILLLRNEIDSLRTDNIKLYEKIKFLQSYPSQSSGQSADDDSIKRYSAQYEQKIDPFSAFSRRERQQRYLNLSAAEKVTLNLGKFVLSNKIARTIVFFYTIFLHCLVFLVLYKLAYTESCKRDFAVDCAKRFAEHMFSVHGESKYQHK